jgi:hypothetical protein
MKGQNQHHTSVGLLLAQAKAHSVYKDLSTDGDAKPSDVNSGLFS